MKNARLFRDTHGNVILSTAWVLIAVSVVACAKKREVTPPDTYPASGKVVSASRKIPVGYHIVIEPANPEEAAAGLVAQDGTFSLETKYMGVKCPGAAAGEYTVTFVPPMSMGNANTIVLPQKIKIEPRENNLTVRIP